jgi:hypothetical protein
MAHRAEIGKRSGTATGMIVGKENLSMTQPSISQLFTQHPESVGETYGEHFGVAMRYSGRLFVASFCAFVHAFLPFCFEKTASGMVRKMVADMDRRMGQPVPASQGVAAE